jgi:hypothetical protein
MTSRQARKLRREQERKAKKAAYKASLQLSTAPAATGVTPENDEFSREFLAYAKSMRERIERRVAARKPSAPHPPQPCANSGFVSEDAQSEAGSAAVAPQSAPSATRSRSEINRANAAHSTGPRSSEGKSASSRNSLKHGLASGQLIIPGEDPAQFEALLNDLLQDHQPASTTEQMLVHEMAQSWWLAQRALRLQNECFTLDGVDEKRLALFLRYHTTHERAFHKALNAWMRLQKERRHQKLDEPAHLSEAKTQNRGFVSQRRRQCPRRLDEPAPLSEAKTQNKAFVSQTCPATDRETASISQNTPPERLAEAA